MNDIEKQLSEYINSNIYNYAFLLNGQWGVGKSYFINQFVEKNKDKGKMFFKISLNGLKKIEDIDILLSEMILKNIRKNSVKWSKFKEISKQFNINNILGLLKKEYAQVAINSILDILTDVINKENCILIFDDLERCKVAFDEIMPYINSFVEIQNMKVILIANEDEIQNEEYDKIKEKTIGHVVEFIPDLRKMYLNFIEKVKDENLNKILKYSKESLIEEFNKQNHHNLRTMQFIIDNFVNFYNIVFKNSEFVNNMEINEVIFNYFIFSSIMCKQGKKIYAWENVEHGYIAIEKDNYNYDNFKYGFKFIDNYIYNGTLNKEEIINIIKNYDQTLLSKDDPYKILKNYYWEMEDEEVYNYIAKIKELLSKNKYKTNNILDILILMLKLKYSDYEIDIDTFIDLFKNVIHMDIDNCYDILFKSEFADFANANTYIKKEYLEICKFLKEFVLNLKFELINRYIEKGEFEDINKVFYDSNIYHVIIVNNNFFNMINIEILAQSIENAKTVKSIIYFRNFCYKIFKDDIYLRNCDINKEVKSIKVLNNYIKQIRIKDNIGKNNAIKGLEECLEKFIKVHNKKENNE